MRSPLLDNLDGLRETASGRWIARCPAHDDRHPSLSIRLLEDGRILVRCFAGCDALDVVHAVGLELRDLFPERGGHAYTPTRTPIPTADVLLLLDHEATVIAIIGADFLSHREIDAATWSRLADAVRRIGAARAMYAPTKARS